MPIAEIAPHMVTSVPRSADVIAPTCLRPFSAMTLLVFRAVVMPVSSTFQMRLGLNLCLSIKESNFEKNASTLFLLNPVARARLVASGVRIDRVG